MRYDRQRPYPSYEEIADYERQISEYTREIGTLEVELEQQGRQIRALDVRLTWAVIALSAGALAALLFAFLMLFEGAFVKCAYAAILSAALLASAWKVDS